MQTTKDIEAFGRACEHLLASVHIHRPLTEAKVLFVQALLQGIARDNCSTSDYSDRSEE